MKAVSFEGKHKMSVADHPMPKLQSPTDALLRVTTTGICGSDLHMYDGRTPLEKGTVVGHEIMGVIEQVGEAVQSIKKGDRVVLPFNISCGFCFNCHHGHTEACLTMNPEAPHAAYGYAGMGPYQAPVKKYNEYLRDLIVTGKAKPSKIVSHRIEIDDAPDAYKKFDQRIDGYTKVLIKFVEKKAA